MFGPAMEAADLVITSYPLLRRDAERYRNVPFRSAILDEAQHIKNPDSQNAQSAMSIRAEHRFVLTGTPVENSVRDIWSLMQFSMPGYLGTRDDFRSRFEQPISDSIGSPEQKRLAKRLHPYVLRRTKCEVIPELPDKIVHVAYCELSGEQRNVYNGLLSAVRREVADAGSAKAGKLQNTMLIALLRLRQVCCDLRLLDADPKADVASSGKMDLLNELIEESIDGNHRVLVFSQFVKMLHLIRSSLEDRGTKFAYLDGSTKDRKAEVDRFQAGTVPVFLISLKAGGVGLNLTTADTVIHVDPWWNPAVEAQATDRAHRIGQEKVVTAYKLVARDTVEEKILDLQRKKQNIIDTTIESEQPLMSGLTVNDIQELLE